MKNIRLNLFGKLDFKTLIENPDFKEDSWRLKRIGQGSLFE